MNIKRFAERNKLNFRKDDCGELIIPGKRGQIFDYGDHFAGVIVSSTPKKWGNARRSFVEAGFAIQQDGDFEGSATFDPLDAECVRLALRYAGIKHRRQPSEKQLESLRKAREKSVQKAVQRQDSFGLAQVV